METIQHVPKTSLARKTREVLQAVQRGQTVVVEHHGEPEVAIVDIVDYYLLRAAMHYHARPLTIEDEGLSEEAVAVRASAQEQTNMILAHYLAGAISLSRAAELLQLPWLDLRTRFLRLDIPIRTAPRDADEIAADLRNAADYASSS